MQCPKVDAFQIRSKIVFDLLGNPIVAHPLENIDTINFKWH